jgi:Tfp pilus assembly protein PilF
LLALSLVAGCASSAARESAESSAESADKFYQVALGSFQTGMYSDAEQNLDRALSIDSEHGDSLYLKGLISLVEGKDMLIAVERQLCLQDDAAELQRERASELHRESREYFRRSVEAFGEDSPGRGRALNSMSVVSLYFGDYETAVLEASEALREQFYGARYSALSNLGWAYYQQEKLVEAISELREAVRMNPGHCVSRYRLAEVYFDYGLADDAAELLDAVVMDENCPIQEALALKGDIYASMGRSRDAATAYRECIQAAPRSCVAEACMTRGVGDVVARDTRR